MPREVAAVALLAHFVFNTRHRERGHPSPGAQRRKVLHHHRLECLGERTQPSLAHPHPAPGGIEPLFRIAAEITLPNIVAEGEFSLFFFNGKYSHTINKSPKTDDFRVQEEHGGLITEVEPDEKLRDAAQNALDKIGEPLLYARVDLVRDEQDEFALMELELIEPALYLRMSDRAPERFAAAIETLLK